jgi:hypothetical protein
VFLQLLEQQEVDMGKLLLIPLIGLSLAGCIRSETVERPGKTTVVTPAPSGSATVIQPTR